MHRNKEQAFKKLCSNPAFSSWCEKKLIMIESGGSIEKCVDDQMKEENLIIEYSPNVK